MLIGSLVNGVQRGIDAAQPAIDAAVAAMDAKTAPAPDGTPVGGLVKPCKTRNFVLILGAPGKYNPKDPHHDGYWGNYFVASQHLFGVPEEPTHFTPETKLLPGECVHWLVYEDPYKSRWESDKVTLHNKITRDGVSKYAKLGGYIGRIKQYIASLAGDHKYVSIDSSADIWETLHKLPAHSLTRMCYFGHGGEAAFYLRWAQIFIDGRGTNEGDSTDSEQVYHSKIDEYAFWLARRARPEDGQISQFYACGSKNWAQKWNAVTGLKSQGAEWTISFASVISDPTLEGVRTDGSPGWTSF